MLTFEEFCKMEEESTSKRMEKAYQKNAKGQEDQETSVN